MTFGVMYHGLWCGTVLLFGLEDILDFEHQSWIGLDLQGSVYSPGPRITACGQLSKRRKDGTWEPVASCTCGQPVRTEPTAAARKTSGRPAAAASFVNHHTIFDIDRTVISSLI